MILMNLLIHDYRGGDKPDMGKHIFYLDKHDEWNIGYLCAESSNIRLCSKDGGGEILGDLSDLVLWIYLEDLPKGLPKKKDAFAEVSRELEEMIKAKKEWNNSLLTPYL